MPASRAARTSTTAFMKRLERSDSLGRAADEMAKPVGALLGDGPVSDALRGRPLGHALHPVLVQVPIGAVLSAAVLDVVQGRSAQSQSRLLMGVAWVSLAPAALSGWAEGVHADERTQRVGIAHAGLNATAAMASALSYLARRRGWSPAAAALTGVAAAALSAGGVLGGHMSLVRKYASHDQPSDSEGVTRARFEAA